MRLISTYYPSLSSIQKRHYKDDPVLNSYHHPVLKPDENLQLLFSLRDSSAESTERERRSHKIQDLASRQSQPSFEKQSRAADTVEEKRQTTLRETRNRPIT